MAQTDRAARLASLGMKGVAVLLALICAVVGALQVWVAARRRSDEFFILRSSGQSGFLAFEFAATPGRLRALVGAGGERGREAVRRSLDIDHLITTGYVFVALGSAEILALASRTDLARKTLIFGLVAAVAGIVENISLRQAATAPKNSGGTAPLVTLSAVLKFFFLAAAAVHVLLWPIGFFVD
jgi:hypothetical protein